MNDKVFWALETLLFSINTNSLIYNFHSCKRFYSYSTNEKDCYKLWYNDYSNRVYLGVCKKSKDKRNGSFDFYSSSADGKVISEVAVFSSIDIYDEDNRKMLISYLLNKLVELGYLYHCENCSDIWFYTLSDMYNRCKSPIIDGVVKDKSYLLSHVSELISSLIPSNNYVIIPNVEGNELYNSLICIDSDLICHFKESDKKLDSLKEFELSLILSMLKDDKRYCVDNEIDVTYSQQKYLSKKYGASEPNVFSYDNLVSNNELFESILFPIFDSNEFKDKYLLPYGWYDFATNLFHPQIEINEDGVKIYVILRNQKSSSNVLSYVNSYFCMCYPSIFKLGMMFLTTEEVPYLYLHFTDEIKERLSELKFDSNNGYLFPIKVKE
jgi:hypothetical protein